MNLRLGGNNADMTSMDVDHDLDALLAAWWTVRVNEDRELLRRLDELCAVLRDRF